MQHQRAVKLVGNPVLKVNTIKRLRTSFLYRIAKYVSISFASSSGGQSTHDRLKPVFDCCKQKIIEIEMSTSVAAEVMLIAMLMFWGSSVS